MANDGARMDALDEPASAPWTLARLEELGVKLRSVNVLAHGELREPIDAKRLALLVRNADYRPRGFGAVVIRFDEPKGSVLVYKSGKFIIVGSKTPANAKLTLDKFVAMLQKVDYPHQVAKFVIANIVNATDLKFSVRLEGLQAAHLRHCSYEPELFPGLIYRMLDPKITILVFISGKVVLTGAKKQEDAERALCKLFPVFLMYRLRYDSDDDSLDSSSDSDHGAEGDDEAMEGDNDDELRWDDSALDL